MKKLSAFQTLLYTASLSSIIAFLIFCSDPENPFENQNNVTISFLYPDSTDTVAYTGDTVVIQVSVTSSAEIDSVKLTIENIDSLITVIPDTINIAHVFSDTGAMVLYAVAFCKKGINRECQRILHVARNPLMPPDTLYAQAFSSSTIQVRWNPISVAVLYNVYRGLSDTGVYSLVQTVSDTSCTDTSLSPITTYFHKVSSVDSLNRESDLSLPVSETTFDVAVSLWDVMLWDEDTWE